MGIITEHTEQSDQHPATESVPLEKRMLLLPHCLRPSQGCPGVSTKQGLQCDGCTRTECQVWAIREHALQAGYTNICIAPGGRLAVRCIAETHPALIIAIACDRELEEGVEAVQSLEWEGDIPAVVQIPLLRDGCVNTEVDLERVFSLLDEK